VTLTPEREAEIRRYYKRCPHCMGGQLLAEIDRLREEWRQAEERELIALRRGERSARAIRDALAALSTAPNEESIARILRAGLGEPQPQQQHDVCSPIYSEERGRWWVDCSCGWVSRDEKSDGGAKSAGHAHLNEAAGLGE